MSRGIWIALVCCIGAAHASPQSDPTAGRAVFTGAATPSPASIDVNPASISLGGNDLRNQVYLAATALVDRYAIDHRDSGRQIKDYTFAPGASAVIIVHIRDRVTLGFQGDYTLQGFIDGGEPLRYHSRGGSYRTTGAAAAAQFKISNRVLFGLSFGAHASRLKLRYARDTALEMGQAGVDGDCGGTRCGIGNPQASELYDVDVSASPFSFSNAITVNIGFVISLARDVWFGIAYHPPPGFAIQNELVGKMRVTQSPRDGGATIDGDGTVYLAQPASVDSELRARITPDLDLHVGLRWEDLSRFRAYSVRGYDSTFAANGIPEWTERPRGFHDPVAVWAGVEQTYAGEALRFGGRIGFETSSLPDERTSPMQVAPTSLTLDAGVQWRVPNTSIVLQGSYGFQLFPTVAVSRSAYDPQDRIDCIASGFDYTTPACEAVRRGYAIPSAAGDYSRMQHAFRFGIRYDLP